MMLLNCCTQHANKFGKLSSDYKTRKGQFSFQSQRKTVPKNVQTTPQLHSFHRLARNCSKSFTLAFSSMWTKNLQIYNLDLEKAEEPEIKLPTSIITDKAEQFQKNNYFCFIDYAKALTVWITTNCGKFWKRWEYQITWPASWEICMQVKNHLLELDMEQQTGYKLGKEYVKAVYCHYAYLAYMRSTSWEIPGIKLESWLLGDISITSDKQMTPP